MIDRNARGLGSPPTNEENSGRQKYFIGSDNDGHYFIIPVSRRKEWDSWIDEEDGNYPDFAEPIDGVNQVEFYLE